MKSQSFLNECCGKNNFKNETPHSVLRQYHSHLKANLHLNGDTRSKHNPSRLKNKNTKIKSLFKDAKQINGETYLNETKRTSQESHRYFSSEKPSQSIPHKLQMGLKKMKIAPTVQICINRQQQDLSQIINQFHDPFSLQEIKEGKAGKESDSFNSSRYNF